MPLIRKGLAAGLILSGGRALGEVGISLMLGGNIADRTETLSLAIYNQVMDVGSSDATIDFVIRHDGIAACTEEVQRIIQHCGAQSSNCIPSGTIVKAGDMYACGVATLCGDMKAIINSHDSKIALLTTRKHAPGLRGIALKATLSAGALPHRLSLSETILIFPQHIALLGGWEALI